MKDSATREVFVVIVVVIAVLIPFLNKAFHIDDPLFLWMGQQIAHHPCDPYGFTVNWYVTGQPMFSVMQNPPLGSYYIALMASFLGWSEPALHGAFLLPAVAAVLGTFFLARRLCNSPFLAALLLLFTPVFLVSATGLMCDVWLSALWVWSIECWMRALDRNSAWLLFFASILVATAVLTKYFGIALVPLLAVYTFARERRVTRQILYLLIPILVVASYEIITKAKYGQGLFSSAMVVSWNANAKPERHLFQQFLIGICFAGGCLFSVLFFVPLLKLNRGAVGSLPAEARGRLASGLKPNLPILIGGMVIFLLALSLFYFGAARAALPLGIATEGALFVTIGLGILILALLDILQHKAADSWLLGLWIFGTFVFAALMNWTITSRTFLPLAPAVTILLMRRLRVQPTESRFVDWWPVLPCALLSLFIATGDYKLAETARNAASDFQQRFRKQSGSIWFEGHWGFQYYMQQWQAKPLDARGVGLASGDTLIVPLNNTNVGRTSPVPVTGVSEQIDYQQFLVATMNPDVHAGFYASKWGPLPWVTAAVPPERYLLFHIK